VTDFGLAKLAGDVGVTTTGDLPGHAPLPGPGVPARRGRRAERCLQPRPDALRTPGRQAGLPRLPPSPNPAPSPREHTQFAPTKSSPRYPRTWKTIILKAIARAPEPIAYPSAQALADDLSRFLDNRPIKARRIDLFEQLYRWSKRNQAMTAMVGVCTVLLVMVMILGTMAILAPPPPPPGFDEKKPVRREAGISPRRLQRPSGRHLQGVRTATAGSSTASAALVLGLLGDY